MTNPYATPDPDASVSSHSEQTQQPQPAQPTGPDQQPGPEVGLAPQGTSAHLVTPTGAKVAMLVSAVMLVLGMIVGVFAVTQLVSGLRIGDFVSAQPQTIPSTFSQELQAGDYNVLQLESARQPLIPLTPQDVTITGPSGEVSVSEVTWTEEISLGADNYLAVLQFEAAKPGTYEFVIDGTGADVVILPSLPGLARENMGALLGSTVAFVLVSLGLIGLIAGIAWRSTARGRQKQLAMGYPVGTAEQHYQPAPIAQSHPQTWYSQVPVMPKYPSTTVQQAHTDPDSVNNAAQSPDPEGIPAGWYPDPLDPSHWRYWDGQNWTIHRS